MKALVTGATGFIGRHLCKALVRAGDDVTALVRASSNRAALDGVSFRVGDVNDPSTLGFDGYDVVFHLAAMLGQPWHPQFMTTNATGVRNVAAACGGARLVVVSSMAAAGPSTPLGRPRTEDDAPSPVSRYGASKLAGEQAARELSARTKITIVRPPIVFGGGDQAMLPLFKFAARGLAIVPTRASMSLVHVEDLVELVRAAARGETIAPEAAPGQGVYFAGFDEAPSFPSLASRVGLACGRSRTRVVSIPRAVLAAGGAAAERWAKWRNSDFELLSGDKAAEALAGDWIVSPAKAHRQLGWRPATTLDERLRETAEGYRASGSI